MVKQHSILWLSARLTSLLARFDDKSVATPGFDTPINLIDGIEILRRYLHLARLCPFCLNLETRTNVLSNVLAPMT